MEKVLSNVKKIHLIGIGGIGMSGLAFILKEKGFIVTGSDIKENYNIIRLREIGISASLAHNPKNIENADLVCFSSAIRKDNPEFLEAKRKNIPLVHRAELLAMISSGKKTIAVTGSHGKTTTTSLLGFVLSSLDYNPAVFVGGVPLNYDTHAWWGDEYFVIEADESDGSFLHYQPEVSIITNIDCEHLDYYQDMPRLKEDFFKFAKKTKNLVIGCGDDSNLSFILKEIPSISYGFSKFNKVRAQNLFFDGFMNFDLVIDNIKEKVRIPIIGEHNILNTLAVLSFFFSRGEDLKRAINVLEDFKGIKRRLQIKEKVADTIFIDDYAHHPTEIESILKAARLLGYKRMFVIFQPHRFSRVKFLADKFSTCFSLADELVVTDIYSASEAKLEGINGEFLYNRIKEKFSRPIRYIPTGRLSEEVPLYLREGDLVLGLGAGDINILMEGIVDEFKRNRVQTKL